MNPNMSPVIPAMCLLLAIFYLSWVFLPDSFFDDRK